MMALIRFTVSDGCGGLYEAHMPQDTDGYPDGREEARHWDEWLSARHPESFILTTRAMMVRVGAIATAFECNDKE